MPSEEKWYALTGRIVDAKVEADGDIHLALEDATGNDVGTVSAEIPVGPKWCEIRETLFGWTTQKFPFSVKTAHAPSDHSNRRTRPKGYAVWEIHSGDENGSSSRKYCVRRSSESTIST
jgi:hypothetical protein